MHHLEGRRQVATLLVPRAQYLAHAKGQVQGESRLSVVQRATQQRLNTVQPVEECVAVKPQA